MATCPIESWSLWQIDWSNSPYGFPLAQYESLCWSMVLLIVLTVGLFGLAVWALRRLKEESA